MITELIITKLIITFNNKNVFTATKVVYINGRGRGRAAKICKTENLKLFGLWIERYKIKI